MFSKQCEISPLNQDDEDLTCENSTSVPDDSKATKQIESVEFQDRSNIISPTSINTGIASPAPLDSSDYDSAVPYSPVMFSSDAVETSDVKKEPSVQFSDTCRVILIPTRTDYKLADLTKELWWTRGDFSLFKRQNKGILTPNDEETSNNTLINRRNG